MLVGVALLDTRLTADRWLGVVIVVVSVTALVLHETRSRRPAVGWTRHPRRSDRAPVRV